MRIPIGCVVGVLGAALASASIGAFPTAGTEQVATDFYYFNGTRVSLERVDATATAAVDNAPAGDANVAYLNPATGRRLWPTREVVVQAFGETSDEAASGLAADFDLVLASRVTGASDQFVFRLREGGPERTIEAARGLQESGRVRWAEPNFIHELQRLGAPNDPRFANQWHLRNTGQLGGTSGADLGAVDAWDIESGDDSVVIAVVDDGVERTHEDLAAAIFVNSGEVAGNGIDDDANGLIDDVFGWDFAAGDNDPSPALPTDAHGTAVAGLAAARGNNGVGVSGVCQRCRILPVKIFEPAASLETIAAAIRYAGRYADVITLSWSLSGPSAIVQSAMQDVSTQGRGGKGAVIVAAAGGNAAGFVLRSATVATAGTHRFRWWFEKDESDSAGEDTAWLAWAHLPGVGLIHFEAGASAWVTSSDFPWTLASDPLRADEGLCLTQSLRAGQVGHDQWSWAATVRTVEAGTVYWYEWVSAEQGFDGLYFDIDYGNDGTFEVLGELSSGVPTLTTDIAYPAAYPQAVAVGATTDRDCRAAASPVGPELDLVAPGGSNPLAARLESTGRLGTYTDASASSGYAGTSASAALTAGVAALVLSRAPDLPRARVIEILTGRATRVGQASYVAGRNDRYGAGRVDAATALLHTPAPPGAPTAITPIAGSGQVAVAFVPPASNGGAPITRYTVTASPGGITESWGASPVLITRLTDGVTYTFTVTATNEAGTGPASVASVPVRPLRTLTNAGAVAGTVTRQGTSAGVAGVVVQLIAESTPTHGPSIYSSPTGADGTYKIGGVQPGRYYVRTSNDQGFVDRVYDGVVCPGHTCSVASGTLVTVAGDLTTTGINFSLLQGGTIEGTVTNATTTLPMAGVVVGFFETSGVFVGSATTDQHGRYRSRALRQASFQVRTLSNSAGALNKVHDTSPVAVTPGQTTTGVDFALVAPTEQQVGTVSGRITVLGTTNGASGVAVQLIPATTPMAEPAYTSANTTSTGEYSITGVAAGTYYARTTNNQGFVERVYPAVICPGFTCALTAGQIVTVTAGAATTGIDLSLLRGGRIHGQITTIHGAPVIGATVGFFDAETGALNGVATSGDQGGYSSKGLRATTFHVRTLANPLGLPNEVFNDVLCSTSCALGAGAPVTVTVGGVTGSINFALGTTEPRAPGPPTHVVGTAGDRQVSVAFAAPADGGVPITSYTVTASPGGATASGSASPLVVSGLTNGTAYRFTVTATNSVGTGLASVASAAVTPQAPTSRALRIGATSGAAGATVQVPITAVTDGTENGFGFSVSWNPTHLSLEASAKGGDATAATLTPNGNKTSEGKLGVLLTWPSGQVVASGTSRELVVLTFRIASGATGELPIQFGDDPVVREVASVTAVALPVGAWQGGAVTVVAGVESDVAPRPTGNGSVTTTDAVQACRFVAGLDSAAVGGEFQRADTAPRSTSGDARLSTADCVQTQRDVAGLDAERPAGGPTSATVTDPLLPTLRPWVQADVTRRLRMVGSSVAAGQLSLIPVRLSAVGDENAVGFSVHFDPAVVTIESVTQGAQAEPATLLVNDLSTSSGRLGVLLTRPTGATWFTGTHDLVVLGVRVAAGHTGPVSLTFGDSPVFREVVDALASPLATTFSNTTLTLAPAASLTVAPMALRFDATKSGTSLTLVTPAHALDVRVVGVGLPTWSIAASHPWMQLTKLSGAGSGRFMVSIVNPGDVIGTATDLSGTITVTLDGLGLTQTIPVRLIVSPAEQPTQPPIGRVETPTHNSTGHVGAIGVTGWALDDRGVHSLRVYRNCLAFDNQTSCQTVMGHSVVYIGDAAFVPGARPDLEASHGGSFPQASRAGWGFLLLTSMLPDVDGQASHGGRGTLDLYVVATDLENKQTLLGADENTAGPIRLTMANQNIAKPFGALDTPSQGQFVGGVVPIFGWALTPDRGDNAVIPIDGSTIWVYIDGAPVGQPVYNQCRGTVGNPPTAGVYCDDDVSNIFGVTTPTGTVTPRVSNPTVHRNLDAGRGAIGSYVLDTTTLSNGMHNIAWSVTDSLGRVEGIGSRNFTVLNAESDPVENAGAAVRASGDLLALAGDRVTARAADSSSALRLRVGFDLASAFDAWRPDADGVLRVTIGALSRVEVALGVGASIAQVDADGQVRPVPVGSRFDAISGRFTWTPGPAFRGVYRFVVEDGGGVRRIEIVVK